ncbi:MAG: MoxR family ATPase [Oscillospiraceae bacterium]|nr:MoxR family ATPase [Oscillospiraceae bacterium]
MNDLLEFLRQEGIREEILTRIVSFRREHSCPEELVHRIPDPKIHYYGKAVWEEALTAILAGENLLLVGPKATGKNVLAENLAAVFSRPEWDISFYLNTDASTLIGADTFRNGEVHFRQGPITCCALHGGFGILDEINMAKNESLAVLHATLDFRRIIDVPGYERITLAPGTRFIGTMNYGYAGTRELNEALASRFVVLNMPIIGEEEVQRLLKAQYPQLKEEYSEQLASLFQDIRKKCDSSEISTKALDLRGLMAAVLLVRNSLTLGQALEISIVNKCFDTYERQLVDDLIVSRIDSSLTREEMFL